MKTVTKLSVLALMLFGAVACDGKKQNNEENTAENVVLVNDGTYEGFVGNDYMIVSLDGSKFQMYKNDLATGLGQVVKGDLNAVRDTATLDNGMMLVGKDASIVIKDTELAKTSDATELENKFTTTLVKDDKSGENFTLKLYTEKGQDLALFNFKGTEYLLTKNANNTAELEYTAENKSLKLSNHQSSFNDGTETHSLSMLTPNVYHYQAVNANATIQHLNVISYSNEDTPVVILFKKDLGGKRVLSQTEAFSKGATYVDGDLEFSIDLKGAALVFNGTKTRFVER